MEESEMKVEMMPCSEDDTVKQNNVKMSHKKYIG